MRTLTVIAVLLTGAAPSLRAQHGGQVEFGGFGSYTRYDKDFQLADQFGAGARLGYFFGDHFSLEVDANAAQPLSTTSGIGKSTAVFGSASLVISGGSAYILGGYSRLHFGPPTPYASELNAIHGGLGERIFFVENRVALRLEARAYYRGPGAGQTNPPWIGHFTAMAGLSFLLGPASQRGHTP